MLAPTRGHTTFLSKPTLLEAVGPKILVDFVGITSAASAYQDLSHLSSDPIPAPQVNNTPVFLQFTMINDDVMAPGTVTVQLQVQCASTAPARHTTVQSMHSGSWLLWRGICEVLFVLVIIFLEKKKDQGTTSYALMSTNTTSY